MSNLDSGDELTRLDGTTHYSILGLTSSATESDIRKSYKALARRLHPDKCKTKVTEDLFKSVVNAYTILTDKSRKKQYDNELVISGLYNYLPRGYKAKTDGVSHSQRTPRKNKPYGEQPYGFGLGSDKPKVNSDRPSNPPLAKSFDIKSYQKRRHGKGDREAPGSNSPKKSGNADWWSRIASEKPVTSEEGASHTDNGIKKEQTAYSRKTANKGGVKETSKEHSEPVDPQFQQRSKLHKKDDTEINPLDFKKQSPFDYQYLRRYARTKFESSEQRKSSSPSLKNFKTSTNIPNFEAKVFELSDILDRLNRVTTSEDTSDSKYSDSDEAIGIHKLSINGGTSKRRKIRGGSRDITALDMHEIADTLESIPLSKKTKYSGDVDNIHEPVNHTISRVSQGGRARLPDIVKVYEKILSISIPRLPELDHLGVLPEVVSRTNVYRESLATFVQSCADMRSQLLLIYMDVLQGRELTEEGEIRRSDDIKYLYIGNEVNLLLLSKLKELEVAQRDAIYRYMRMDDASVD